MIHVRKGPPPVALTSFRQTLDTSTDPPRRARYDGPAFTEVKAAIRVALCEEQRHVCCYCTDRITLASDAMKVEHRVPQHGPNAAPSRDLDWANLLGACSGSKPRHRGADALHCDSAKGDAALTLDPTNESHVATISYTRGGRITSSNARFDAELNEVLNLNLDALVELREGALAELTRLLHERHGVNDLPVAKLRKLRDHLRTPPDGRLRPFAGYLCWWLERAIDRRAGNG